MDGGWVRALASAGVAAAVVAAAPATATADGPHRVVRARVVAPLATWARYQGDIEDGTTISVAGMTVSYEHGPLVIDGGLRIEIIPMHFSSIGYGTVFDGRAGGRLPLRGSAGEWGIDGLALVGLRYMSYSGNYDGNDTSESLVAATGALGTEIARRVEHRHFTCRILATGVRKLDREVRGYPATFGVETGLELGVDLGWAW